MIPPLGVYAVRARIGKKIFNGMANIGRRPSFKKNDRVHLETHIFNFHRSLYNKEIIVEFVQKIREEKSSIPARNLSRNFATTARGRNVFSPR